MSAGLVDYLRQNTEKVKLLGYFVLMLVLAAPLSTMLGTAWRRAHVFRAAIKSLSLIGLSLAETTVLLFGVFLGLLTLMTVDPKKRWQAFLLWIGVGVVLLGLQSMGLFLPNISLIGDVHWLLGGAAFGILIGGGRRLLDINDTDVLEFRRASTMIYYTVAVLVVVAVIEYHVRYPNVFAVTNDTVMLRTVDSFSATFARNNLIQHLLVSGAFVVTVRQFVRYDAEQDFFVLGPRASGKSLFLIGGYLEALERSRNDESRSPLNPSQDLMEMIEALDHERSGWIVDATRSGQFKTLDFQYVQGSVFPMNIRLSGVDYAGEYLGELPGALTGAIPEDEGDDTLWELADRVETADTLLLVVDIERYVNNEPLEISEYFSILQAADIDNVLIVGTKADYLADRFTEQRGLEPYRYFDDFKQFVNDELQQNNQIDTLIQETAGSEIHPVYFQTRENEAGDRDPMRDDSGSVMTVGFDELLEKLGRS